MNARLISGEFLWNDQNYGLVMVHQSYRSIFVQSVFGYIKIVNGTERETPSQFNMTAKQKTSYKRSAGQR